MKKNRNRVLLAMLLLVGVSGLVVQGAPGAGRLPYDDYQELLRWQVMAPGVDPPVREYLILTVEPLGDQEREDLARAGLTLVATVGTTAVVRGSLTAFSLLGPDGVGLPWVQTVLPSIPLGVSQQAEMYGISTGFMLDEISMPVVHDTGLTGKGVTVGVIDGGFTGQLGIELGAGRVQYLQVAYTNGVPEIVTMTRADFTAHTHGEICARGVLAVAPDANLVLMSAETVLDRIYFLLEIAAGRIAIDVLSDSTYLPFPFDHNDGTGILARAGDAVVESGVLYAYALGNFARGDLTDRSFYKGRFVDSDGNSSHDFTPAASTPLDKNTLAITVDPWMGSAPVVLTVILSWDGWEQQARDPARVGRPGYWTDEEYIAVQDIDLIVYRQQGTRVVEVGRSDWNQLGPLYSEFRGRYPTVLSVDPIEVVQVRVTDPGTYLVEVFNYTMDHPVPGVHERDAELHLYIQISGGASFSMEHHSVEGSLVNMGGAHHVTAVGAVGWTDNGWKVASYSSQGPTSDGRLKPEVVAPTAYESGLTSPRFATGTSASAPLVAGLAALLIEANPSLTPQQVQAIIAETAASLCGARALSGLCRTGTAVPGLCGEDGWSYAVGCGLVNAEAAVQKARAR